MELGEDEKSVGKLPKKLFKVSQSGDSGSLKITISGHTAAGETQPGERRQRKKEARELLSPSDESKIRVVNDAASPSDLKKTPSATSPAAEKCSVSINFDMNTKKLWQELHYPYGNYTSFFRHLILLEKYWRTGDLVLGPSAGLKAASYLKSVQNRLKSYEARQWQSSEELSAATRPDLGQPAAPQLIHVPGEAVLANLPSPGAGSATSPSTILRIPRVPTPRQPASPSSLLSPPPSQQQADPAPAPVTPSPKIRVRQDLMSHLGLVAATPPSTSSSSPAPGSQLRAALTVTPVVAPPPTSHSTPNLARLLSDAPPSRPSPDLTPPEPEPVPQKSSNSQLFKSTESTGAIPLTFNNSIAEVLAAASKAKAAKSREPSPKPEITITAKSSNKTQQLSAVLASQGSGSQAAAKPPGGHKLPASISAPSPSGGGLSILKRPGASSASSPGTATVSPLSNMSKLLAAQAPGLPPHVIAQQTLPGAKAGPGAAKVMSRPPGPVMSNLRPVQISGAKQQAPATPQAGIQSLNNKKSLNTVLDRLGSLGTGPGNPANTSLASSLVQQLQAPPMSGSRPGPKSYKEAKASLARSGTGVTPISQPAPIGQPMVQFPDTAAATSLLSQSLLLGPNPAAAQAALMMAGLNGLSPVQAQAAMQELLQQQQQLMQQSAPQPRLRAPPPLKNMSSASRKPE